MRASVVVNCQRTWRSSSLVAACQAASSVLRMSRSSIRRVRALAGQGGQLDLGDVEPGAVLGCVVDLEPLGQRACFGWLERFVEQTEGVRVEVVHDQDDPLRVGVVDVEKLIDFRDPVDPGPLRAGVDPAAAGEGLDPHERSSRCRARTYSESSLRSWPGQAGIGSRAWPGSWYGFSSIQTTGTAGS